MAALTVVLQAVVLLAVAALFMCLSLGLIGLTDYKRLEGIRVLLADVLYFFFPQGTKFMVFTGTAITVYVAEVASPQTLAVQLEASGVSAVAAHLTTVWIIFVVDHGHAGLFLDIGSSVYPIGIGHAHVLVLAFRQTEVLFFEDIVAGYGYLLETIKHIKVPILLVLVDIRAVDGRIDVLGLFVRGILEGVLGEEGRWDVSLFQPDVNRRDKGHAPLQPFTSRNL